MASTYALPLGGSSHGRSAYEGHTRSHSYALRAGKPTPWGFNPEGAPASSKNSADNSRLHSGHATHHSHNHPQHRGEEHGHGPSHSFANAQHISESMKGRTREESGEGRANGHTRNTSKAFDVVPITEEPGNSRSWLNPVEALTAILIPLPFLFASLAYPYSVEHVTGPESSPLNKLKDAVLGDAVEGSPASSHIPESSAFIQACCLTSGTLILVGLIGSAVKSDSSLDPRKSGLGNGGVSRKGQSFSDPSTWARIAARALSVALPFYASMHLGGPRTGITLLTTVAAGVNAVSVGGGSQGFVGAWKSVASKRKLTCLILLLGLFADFSGLYPGLDSWSLLKGHGALALSVLFVPVPIPTTGSSLLSSRIVGSTTETHQETPMAGPKASAVGAVSPLIHSTEDIRLTLTSGVLVTVFTILASTITSAAPSISISAIAFSSLSIGSALAAMLFSSPSSLGTTRKAGIALGYIVTNCLGYFMKGDFLQSHVAFAVLSLISFVAVYFDTTQSNSAATHSHKHGHGHSHSHGSRSRITSFLLKQFSPGSIMHGVLVEKDSRRIAYFALLNLAFMMVQFFYGFVSGSLGLLTDSIHMLFDCVGLAVGLAAAVMSKWPPDAKFPYGYGKVDTLSGFANGIFLMLVSIEIIFDAFERLFEGHELQRLNELLIVSVLGFLVNLIGLTAFGHAHHGHGHDHGHDHSHDNENMQGIFLHIMADALGSVAVIISTLLTKYYGWSGWDPLASCAIAILIFASAIPLVKSSGMRLLLSLPGDVEYRVRNTLQEINTLRGVVGYSVPRFWLEDAGAAHAHDHAHDHDHGHGHEHSHGGGCTDNQSHGNGHVHKRSHAAHDQFDDHSHSHGHSHDDHHSHDSHSHSHSHDHSHDHSHAHAHDSPQKVLGVIHIIAARAASLEDVRQRTESFLKERNLDVVVHVEYDGDRCWCGGGASKMS